MKGLDLMCAYVHQICSLNGEQTYPMYHDKAPYELCFDGVKRSYSQFIINSLYQLQFPVVLQFCHDLRVCFMFTKSCRGAYVGQTMGNKGDEGRMEDVYGKGL